MCQNGERGGVARILQKHLSNLATIEVQQTTLTISVHIQTQDREAGILSSRIKRVIKGVLPATRFLVVCKQFAVEMHSDGVV